MRGASARELITTGARERITSYDVVSVAAAVSEGADRHW
jgi:hypothetical protein